jgi:hypothetical protein
MPKVVITFVGLSPLGESGDCYAVVPCSDAHHGADLVCKAWIELSGHAAQIAKAQLERGGIDDAEAALARALFRYGIQRMEAIVCDSLRTGVPLENTAQVWKLTADDLPQILKIASEKEYTYRARSQRDLFCPASSFTGETTVYSVENVGSTGVTRRARRSLEARF